MANERDEPYGGFNFVVELGDGTSPGEPAAGFQEVSGLSMTVDVIEYRNGNEALVRKLPGLARYENVVMRRGFTGSRRLYQWIDSVRSGLPSPIAHRAHHTARRGFGTGHQVDARAGLAD